MTKDAMRRLVREAIDTTEVENSLIEIIQEHLDIDEIAQKIWENWESELTEAAAEVAAEEILPF
jgi:histone H3/H4